MGYAFFADESNLNLMTEAELRRAMSGYPVCKYRLAPTRLWGWTSNLVLMVHKRNWDVIQCHTTMNAIDALSRDFPICFVVTDRPPARCPMVCSPGSAPGDHDRTVKVETEIHLMNAGLGHHRTQPSAVMCVKQQEATTAGADQLTPGCATASERKLI